MYDNVYLVTKRLILAEPADVRALAARVGPLPDGYEQYVTRLGHGLYCTFIRIAMPAQIVKDLRDTRARWREYFNWDEETLAKSALLKAVRIGDTLHGDELVYHRGHPESIFVLPRYDSRIYEITGGLEPAIDWACRSKKLTTPIAFRYFESEVTRKKIELRGKLSCARFKAAMLARQLHTHVGADEKKERFLLLFFEPLGASLAYYGESGALTLHLDPEAREAAGELLDHLQALGFTPVDEEAGEPAAKPHAMATPRRKPDATAEQVVAALMKAMRAWERGCDPSADWDGFVRASQAIAAELFVENPRAFCRSTPSCYDSKANPIVSSGSHGTTAIVVTERALRDGDTIRMEYTLEQQADGWRVVSTRLAAPSVVEQRF
ncbi:MAG: hypothetical protein HYV63_03555 [Candidatus Schekmanbacteria bacterium]|nr:hypothetical protein [Candidatus Schekmanbacteria bacterium]